MTIGITRGLQNWIADILTIMPGGIGYKLRYSFYRTVAVVNQGHDPGTIVIEDDVWIGANVVILPNVTVGKGSVIGSGAVVIKNVDSYSIVAGVPAKKIADRL